MGIQEGRDFERLLDEHSHRLEVRLSSLLEERVARSREYHNFIAGMYDSLLEFVARGGKRMASYTTVLVARGYGIQDGDSLQRACEAIELYRHSILIHDDLVDGDDLRRGRPTIHRSYSGMRDDRLGLGMAVFCGNILYCLALDRAFGSVGPRGAPLEVAAELARANLEVNESQALDLYMEGRPSGVGEWRTMASKRAASLFRATLRIGGIVAGRRGDLDALGKAGERLGFLFDIQDDIIDTLAGREEYGRNPGSDLRTLKRPLHIILAHKRAGVRGILESPGADLGEVRRILRETGALEEAWAVAEKHGSEAMRLIEGTGLSQNAKRDFRSLLAYMRESLDWYR
jgi:geranylgeranyl diphosphate synthase type I